MTSITSTASLFTTAGAQHKALTSSRLSAQIKTAVNEVKIADKPYTTEHVPAEPLTRRDQRGVKDATALRSLLDAKTAFAVKQSVSTQDWAADTTKKANLPPIKVPPRITPVPADDVTTKHMQPIKVPPATTDPVILAPIDELAEQPPVKAPPGGIWTPYDPPYQELPSDGGFVITMGPDGTAICGPGPSGPFKWPPIEAAEEM